MIKRVFGETRASNNWSFQDTGAMSMNPGSRAIFATLIAGISASTMRPAAQVQSTQAVRNPVVVELFTSEGCSSCPPADQLLAKLEEQQPIENVEIIPLEEHVTYWNQGGWLDPYSSDVFTARQSVYAGMLSKGNSYTPQMIVDGETELIGSRAAQAVNSIERAGIQKKVEVTVTPGEAIKGAQTFQVKVGALPNASGGDAPEVWLAVTETGLHNQVKGGENSGQDLHHAAVVRDLRRIGTAKGPGETSFSADERVKIDKSWKRENTHVVVFLQDKKSKKVLGAGMAVLPS
jgi:hypothetical protein